MGLKKAVEKSTFPEHTLEVRVIYRELHPWERTPEGQLYACSEVMRQKMIGHEYFIDGRQVAEQEFKVAFQQLHAEYEARRSQMKDGETLRLLTIRN